MLAELVNQVDDAATRIDGMPSITLAPSADALARLRQALDALCDMTRRDEKAAPDSRCVDEALAQVVNTLVVYHDALEDDLGGSGRAHRYASLLREHVLHSSVAQRTRMEGLVARRRAMGPKAWVHAVRAEALVLRLEVNDLARDAARVRWVMRPRR